MNPTSPATLGAPLPIAAGHFNCDELPVISGAVGLSLVT